jgi:hypothetical protein
VQQLQDPSIDGLIELIIDRPHLVGRLGAQPLSRHRRFTEPLALAATLRHSEAFLAPQALGTLAVDRPALLKQPLVRSAIPPRGRSREISRSAERSPPSSATTCGSRRRVERC